MNKRGTVGLVAALSLLPLEEIGHGGTQGKPKSVRARRKANKLASANRKTNRRK